MPVSFSLNGPTWLDLAKEGLAKALCACFGLPWESDAALSFIRYAYRSEDRAATNPEPSITEDVVYIDAVPVQDRTKRWSETKNGSDSISVTKTIPLYCPLVFYGPHAIELATQAQINLMVDTGSGSPRDILKQYRMTIPERPDDPQSTRDVVANSPRERADLDVRINLLHTSELPYSPLERVPDIEMSVSPN